MIAGRTTLPLLVAVASSAVAAPLRGQTHHINLEEGFPLRVEDAYASPYRAWELEIPFRYDRTEDARDLFVVRPELAYGILRNADVSAAVPARFGSADRTGSGDIDLEAFYNFNTEGLILPAFAVEGTAILPTGRDTDGVDTAIRLIATKSIGNRFDRLHVNVQWRHDAEPRPEERDDRWTFIVGYSGRAGPDLVIVADVVREQERSRGEASNVVEAGFRYMLTPLIVLSSAAGAGFGDESPPFRFVLGLQAELTPALVF